MSRSTISIPAGDKCSRRSSEPVIANRWQLGQDGWLSSRQTVLAAFDGDHVVGHLCFSLQPFRSEFGQARVNSRVDSFAVDSGYTDEPVDEMLYEVAEYRAKLMRCPPPRVAVPA